MQLRHDLQIATMIRAMTDVIIPAIPPEHSLAMEQSQLMVGMLNLMSNQLRTQYSFDCDELRRLVGVAAKLERICAGYHAARDAAGNLLDRKKEAAHILRRPSAKPSEIYDSIRGLRKAITEVTSAVVTTSDCKEDVRIQTTNVILEYSREQCLRDRSLMAPQGWEKTPIPAIASLLHEDHLKAVPEVGVDLGGLV